MLTDKSEKVVNNFILLALDFNPLKKNIMPELPEVEVMRRKLEKHVLNANITKIEVPDVRIAKHLVRDWEKGFTGKKLQGTKRIGKYLFLDFANTYIHLHFGMTGSLEFHPHDQEFPDYSRLHFYFDNGIRMDFTDPRTFGKLDVINSVESFITAKKLGVDLLDSGEKEAEQMFAKSKISLKAVMLKQGVVAGIGNWLADEALFRAKINPKASGSEIGMEKRVALLETTKEIALEAIEADTHYGDFPPHFFVHYRKENAICPCEKQAPIKRLSLGGRTTYYCSECQN